MMRAFMSALSVPKDGSRSEECEDAFSVEPVVPADRMVEVGPVLLAVADGASESLLAKDWAQTLTSSLVRSISVRPEVCAEATKFSEAIVSASYDWDTWLSEYLAERERIGNAPKWYERPGLERGAYATVLAALFTDGASDSGTWFASAVGDTCMFQVRDDHLIRSLPLDSPSAFDTSPRLLNSKNRDLSVLAKNVVVASGSYNAGDHFFVATDALAAWFLSGYENGERPWEVLRDVSCAGRLEDFASWVQSERISRKMRNDDATLVHIDFG